MSTVFDWVERSERKLSQMGEKLDKDLEVADWKTKFVGLFKAKKNLKEVDRLAFTGSMGDALARSTVEENPMAAAATASLFLNEDSP